jgi:hypothetical protein
MSSSILVPTFIDVDWAPDDEFSLVELRHLAHIRPIETIEVGVPSGNGYFSATTGPAAAARLDAVLDQLQSMASWVVLKDIQQDVTYAPRIDRLFQAILRGLNIELDRISNHRCHVFISSDGAKTPLHADDCNGVLIQMSGRKEIVTYDMGKNYFSPRLARLRARTPRVFPLPANQVFLKRRHALHPGAALTIPWNWPHEAITPAGSHSLSLNVSFETKQTRRFGQAAVTNDLLLHVGRSPLAIGMNKRSDAVKALIGSALDRVGLLEWMERNRQIGDDIVR